MALPPAYLAKPLRELLIPKRQLEKTGEAPYASLEVEEVVTAYRRLEHALRIAGQTRGRRLGITPAQLAILVAVSRTPGLTINGLAEATHTHQSTVSALTRALVTKGFIGVRKGREDQRVVLLRLTPNGRRMLQRALRSEGWPLRDAVQNLTPSERTAALATLEDLTQAVARSRT